MAIRKVKKIWDNVRYNYYRMMFDSLLDKNSDLYIHYQEKLNQIEERNAK